VVGEFGSLIDTDLPIRSLSHPVERYSLVLYDIYRSSLINVERASNSVSENSIRKSCLYESFSSKKTHEDPIIKDLNVDTCKMLNFFDLPPADGDKKSENSRLIIE
jgi:hypothetical protein